MLSKSKSPANRFARFKLESVKTEPEEAESVEQLVGSDQNLSYQNPIYFHENEQQEAAHKVADKGAKYMDPD